MTTNSKALIIGLSGASSSGKTSLSHLLRKILPNVDVLHEDDFFKHEEEIPVKDNLQDWDCAEAIDLPALVNVLQEIRHTGELPPNLESKESQSLTIDIDKVSESTISRIKDRVAAWIAPGQPGHLLQTRKIFIIEGFLLYSYSTSVIWPYLDLKMFLQVSYAAAKARRQTRSGYITHTSIWQDPPHYVDQVVWPNYRHNHEWMFEDCDVEGNVKEGARLISGIRWSGMADMDMESTLTWAVELLMEELPSLLDDEYRKNE
ncbi:Bgt-872 [Blumeria graminis f. sp. tritici]|uniref:Bgt-872 n=2 Tax=Blumeria graminis f. sp. tritici TaxID=62690 RepID=A0A381LIY6_BLUGR|nr:Nicotinamide riboside kinase [Blumeria graminis f. sp. tritici 96224]VDB93025.1 Bgt-872 [Blumeria graminis f. sp. tritici]